MRCSIRALMLLVVVAMVWPAPAHAQAAQAKPPNVLIFIADDLGFSDVGCYGGEIATPVLDSLAAGGLRFTQFYNTARCWPTRSALLTGYYPQQIHMDPRQGRLPGWAKLLPRYLATAGYHSYHSGKWHIFGAPRPVADGGFDHSYTIDDHDRYFYPRNTTQDDKPLPPVAKDAGYYATTAIAQHAIDCLQEHQKDHAGKPFFSYVAFTAPHWPLQALPEDIERYRDRYLAGWEVIRQQRYERQKQLLKWDVGLSQPEREFGPRGTRPEFVNKIGPGEVLRPLPWESLTPEQQRLQATKMAIHAAMVDRMDQEIGRVLEQVRAMGAWENTLILFLSDNGASAELAVRGDMHDPSAAPGSGASFLCLGPGWSTVSNTPFRRHKIWVHEGGISTPLIVHWPAGIQARGELRNQVGHVIDIVPTLLQLAGVQQPCACGDGGDDVDPKMPPMPGYTLVPALRNDPLARDGIYFHHEGNRAYRLGDWKIVSSREGSDRWELYDLSKDRAEQHDLAAQRPDKVEDLSQRWQMRTQKFAEDAGEVIPLPGAKEPGQKQGKAKANQK